MARCLIRDLVTHRACDWGLVLSANLESKHSKWQRIQSSRDKIDLRQWYPVVCTGGSHPGGFLWQNSVRVLVIEPHAHSGQGCLYLNHGLATDNHKLQLPSGLLSLVHFSSLPPFPTTPFSAPLYAPSFWLPHALHYLSSPLFSSWCWTLHTPGNGLALALSYILYTQCIFNFWSKISVSCLGSPWTHYIEQPDLTLIIPLPQSLR